MSGWSVFPFNESDVVDLIDYSCLNGWTMGNIAFSPTDAVRFGTLYSSIVAPRRGRRRHARVEELHRRLEPGPRGARLARNSAQILRNCAHFETLRPSSQVQYGLGLMNWPLQFRVNGTCAAPGCSPGMAEWRHIGHPGMDWGSGMLTNGHVPELALSVSIATSTAHGGMNASLTRVENERFLNGSAAPPSTRCSTSATRRWARPSDVLSDVR